MRVVVLGAGFGGLELVTRLSDAVPDKAQVTLIDQNDAFMFGFSKLDVMFGRRRASEVWIPYRNIAKPGVEFRQEKVTSIDPESRRVTTDRASYEADILVVALGADYDLGATPGLVEDGYEFYTPEGAERAGDALARFSGGAVVVGVLGPFFKCPGAPNEAALLVHDFLTGRGIRDSSTIHLVSPLPMPIPISRRTSEAIAAILAEHGIEYWPSSRVTRLDPASHIAHLEDGRQLPYDLFLGIPVHRAPEVVLASGLAEDGWIPVDPRTFATKFPGVFAVGDVTSAPVPRAGGIAEGEAATAAEVLVAQLTGGATPPPYDGAAGCYVELGNDRVGRIDVNFLSYDTPVAKFTAPSATLADEKRAWGATRAARWFGDGHGGP
ncbi:MAG TPA: FAD-dependent oxidoreductase [Acidimicrobiales bacterium]|nr:FAD-dependent oxidoreductase [Acidimicrobiales bacterium]